MPTARIISGIYIRIPCARPWMLNLHGFHNLDLCATSIIHPYLSIELFERLKKYHPATYQQMSFKRLFGMSGENAVFHLIKPQEFFRFLLAPVDLQDHTVKMLQQRI